MTSARPTLAELRARVHKQRHREIGNFLARRYARPAAVYGTWLALRLGLSAHLVTLASLVAGLAGAAAIGAGARWGLLLGAIGLHLAFWLDHVDGQVARWRGTASLDGVFLDYLMHHAQALALGFALGYGLAAGTGHLAWVLPGFLVGAAWLGLGLVNDCRYKAFFQRLKAGAGAYRVDCGAGGRPAPAPGWPRRGAGLLSWPLAKLCEPHLILLAITAMAVVSVPAPGLAAQLQGGYLLALAFLAPALLVMRVARIVRSGRVEADFATWFAPERTPGLPADLPRRAAG